MDFSSANKANSLSRQVTRQNPSAPIFNNLKQGKKNIWKAPAFPNILFALLQVIKIGRYRIYRYFLPAKTNIDKHT